MSVETPQHSTLSLDRYPNKKECGPEIGDLLVGYLEDLGAGFVFGVPGGAIEPLYNALARSERRGGPRAVVARHESGAAFMADGYARQTGTLGVCCATTGPGATNLITGISSAYANHVPLLVITAQTAMTNFGRDAFQDSSCTGVNTVGMFQYCTRYNTLVSHVDQFEHKLASAVRAACQAERGPAHLSIPVDLLRKPAPVAKRSYDLEALLHQPSLVDIAAVATLCNYVADATKVVLVVGGGCSEAIGTILELAVAINAVIVTTPQGKGLVNANHPLFRGVFGFAGHQGARAALLEPDVDTVVVIGTRLGEWASNGWDGGALLNNRLIHVDSIEGNFSGSPMARLHVLGRINNIFQYVIEELHARAATGIGQASVNARRMGGLPWPGGAGSRAWAEPKPRFELDAESKCYDDTAPIKPQRLMRELTRLFPANTCFLADTGNSVAWAIHYLHPRDRRMGGKRRTNAGLFRASLDFAAMGWALGAAIGTALGKHGGPVVCITGDGSLLMNGQEITVAIQERLPVIFVVLNDSALGMVKHGQRLTKAEPVGFELPEIDYCAYAEALGAKAYLVHSPQDLQKIDIAAIIAGPGPTLIDVRIDPEEVPPMGVRAKVLEGPR